MVKLGGAADATGSGRRSPLRRTGHGLVRPLAAVATAACVAVLAASCSGDDDEGTPDRVPGRERGVRRRPPAAPGEVAFEDGTEISECLPPDQSGGDLANVGEEMIAAATALNAQARENPTGAAAVQLGYLVGAVENGADGIHADLVRRLNSAARFTPGGGLLPAEFERTFGEGYNVGQDSG